jgi:glycosyltransferase involved in cell wall biosynthesis
MASGLPVIATHVGGNGELVTDGACGCLVPPADAAAMAAAMDAYARDAGLRHRHAEAARRRVEERFSIAGMVERYQHVYDRLLANRAERPF